MKRTVLGTCATFSATVILTRTKKVGQRCGGAKVKKWRGGSGVKIKGNGSVLDPNQIFLQKSL